MKLKMRLLASVAALAIAAPVHAGTFTSKLVSNVDNTFRDDDRESLFDLDGDNEISAGDVLIGYLDMSARVSPPDLGLPPNSITAIFAQEIQGVQDLGTGSSFLSMAPLGANASVESAEVAAFLNSITPGVTWGGGDVLAAVYDDVAGQDVLAPVDQAGVAGYTVFDPIFQIANDGALQIVLGFDPLTFLDPTQTDFWEATVGNLVVNDLDELKSITVGAQVGGDDFVSGLSVLDKNTGFDFEREIEVTHLDGVTETTHDLGVVQGQLNGAEDLCNFPNAPPGINPFFSGDTDSCTGTGTISFGANTQNIEFYGFASKADFLLHPVAEPTSVALVGLGLFGLAAGLRRRRMS